jgi:hypothetical protein
MVPESLMTNRVGFFSGCVATGREVVFGSG